MINRFGELAGIVLCLVTLGAVLISHFSVSTTEDWVITETQGPVTYYMNHCARCHRSPEEAYTEFKVPKRGEALRSAIRQMMENVARSASDEIILQQQYELHLSILDKTPYLWMDRSITDRWTGEIIPDSEIFLQTSTQRWRAKIEGHRFTLPAEPGTIQVQRLNQHLTLQVP
ncbi:MAG: hypothetical protein KatS3mg104_3122 [Phycisphaerae bacterium]|jgi:hypothetical protein|nr:MAG: hypothetical protein KatS3mg104_3122 [Phycisphaerae bacterium]